MTFAYLREALSRAAEKWPHHRHYRKQLARAYLRGFPDHHKMAQHKFAADQIHAIRCIH
jgi:hypothetical protein